MIRLSDIAEVRRGYADPPQPMFRVNGKPAIGLGIAMRDGGDILALGQQHRAGDGRDPRPTCRSASSRILVADQAVTVDLAIGEFMTSLWQAIADHPRRELRQPRRAARARSWRWRSR